MAKNADTLDAESAGKALLKQGGAAIKRAARELGISAEALAHLSPSAASTATVECLTVGDLEELASSIENRGEHIDRCAFCSAVVAAINAPSVPERRDAFVAAATGRLAQAELADEKVLVVEDDTAFGRLIAKAFRDAGAKVAIATSVEEAEREAGQVRPDFLVADVVLGSGKHQTAYELLERLRSSGAVPPHKISISARDEAKNSRKAGFDAFVSKPLEPGNLVKRAIQMREAARVRPNDPRAGFVAPTETNPQPLSRRAKRK